MRVAGRAGARARRSVRRSSVNGSCSRPTSRRAPSMRWRSSAGVQVTLDNLHPLRRRGREMFRGRELFVRLDTGSRTRASRSTCAPPGAHSKFGVPLFELDELGRLARELDVRIVGLHAHMGSGVFDVRNWVEHRGAARGAGASAFPTCACSIIGGGLGVPERPAQLGARPASARRGACKRARGASRTRALARARPLPGRAGGRAARAGHAAQGQGRACSTSASTTGMNSLIRPALYGAHHEIVNLTRLDEPATETCQRRGTDLRERRRARPGSAAAADPRGRRAAHRQRGRVRPRHELATTTCARLRASS